MARPPDFPTLSDGATELLRIARENDKHRAIARNAAILQSLTFSQRLIEACQENWRNGLRRLTKEEHLAPALVGFVAQALRRIHGEVNELFSHPPSGHKLPVATDYNVHALQAEAQMLADIGWPERAAQDFDGPPLEEAVGRLKETRVRDAWQLLIQHYVANILQDVFASARIREAVPDLDPEAESLLRTHDAYDISRYVATSLPNEANLDPTEWLFVLDQAVDWATE